MFKRIVYTTRIEDAPDLKEQDLIRMADASELLGISIQTINYYIMSGRLISVVRGDEEYTSYKRLRRWLIRDQVQGLKIDLIDNQLNGREWCLLDDGDIIALLPEVIPNPVKGDNDPILRQITLNHDDTGDLEIDIRAQRENGHCTIFVDVQSEARYPDMSGIPILLLLPKSELQTITNKSGAATFGNVACGELHLARITIKTTPQPQ